MSFVLFYTLFWMFNVLFYVIGYNSRYLNKKEHIWRKFGLKQKVELRLQLGKSEAAAPCILELKKQNSSDEAAA